MDFALRPVSDAGHLFAAACEGHEQTFFARAVTHDRQGSFPAENIADLIASGVIRATVPAALGGLGVVRMRDMIAAMSRLARGDGATAIATNMHLYRVWVAARHWRAARLAGDAAREASLATFLETVAAGRNFISILATENGTDVLSPLARAEKVEGGWRLNGRKAFATGSPVADTLMVRLRFTGVDGDDRAGTADIPANTPGIRNLGDWDALGMRASGSHDVVLEDVFIPDGGIADGGPWGVLSPGYMVASIACVMGLAASFLGIAEAAHALALRQIAARGRSEKAAIQHLAAEMEIDLAAARAILARSADHADALFDAHPVAAPMDDLRAMTKDFQCAKQFVTRKAIEIVDRAMTVSGGAGYMTRNPLARLYRDVRAGPFMQPFSPIEGYELIGKLALDLPV